MVRAFARLKSLFANRPRPSLRWPRAIASPWHDTDGNVTWAKAQLYSSRGQDLQAFLLDGLLSTRFYPGDRLTTEQAALEYARFLGYIECFKRLQEAAVAPIKPLPDLPADYDQSKPADFDEADRA